MRLRGRLLPLVKLSDALGVGEKLFRHPETGEWMPDLRAQVAEIRGGNHAGQQIETAMGNGGFHELLGERGDRVVETINVRTAVTGSGNMDHRR